MSWDWEPCRPVQLIVEGNTTCHIIAITCLITWPYSSVKLWFSLQFSRWEYFTQIVSHISQSANLDYFCCQQFVLLRKSHLILALLLHLLFCWDHHSVCYTTVYHTVPSRRSWNIFTVHSVFALFAHLRSCSNKALVIYEWEIIKLQNKPFLRWIHCQTVRHAQCVICKQPQK